MIKLEKITSYLHTHIPITAQLGAKVASFDGQTVVISAPLKPNLNHTQTAFGGSISAVGIISGWTLLHVMLKQLGIKNRLVIQKSFFEFKKPIDSDFNSICSLPDDETWTAFLETLQNRGKARINLQATVECLNGIAGHHKGVYVASLN